MITTLKKYWKQLLNERKKSAHRRKVLEMQIKRYGYNIK